MHPSQKQMLVADSCFSSIRKSVCEMVGGVYLPSGLSVVEA